MGPPGTGEWSSGATGGGTAPPSGAPPGSASRQTVAPAPAEPHPPCADLSAVEARYLLAILDLARAAGAPTQAAVARRVGGSAPPAPEMIPPPRAPRLLHPRALAPPPPRPSAPPGPPPPLTHAGQSAALVLSSRRAAAHMLVHDLLGVDDQLSRAEADLLASSVSPALGRRLHAGRGRPPRASDAQTNRPSPT